MPDNTQPDVTRSKSVRRPPQKSDPSPAREGQRGEPTAREGSVTNPPTPRRGETDTRPPTEQADDAFQATLDQPVKGKLSGRTPAREAEAGKGRPNDPQVPRGREVISKDKTPETDTGRGPKPQEEGRTAR